MRVTACVAHPTPLVAALGTPSAQRPIHDTRVAAASFTSDLPRPEFLSLTYTLPYHLVGQVSAVAESTNRSQSEILAESIRLYLKAWAARQEHTRISTVEGFCYQEIAVADATILTAPTVPTAAPMPAPVSQDDPAQLDAGSEEPIGPPEQLTAEPQEDAELALDDEGALLEIADPAADVRRSLQAITDEPLDSDALRDCLEQIMRGVDKKDFSPADHSTKVATMARQLAVATGLSSQLHDVVYIAGLVHDIGKACIPDEIIQKAKPSSDEMTLIRKYPEFGTDLLGAIPAMEPVAKIVAAHQERWNGTGYPMGVDRDDIPVGAQIVAICDVYLVLNIARRYRPAYSEERALQIIKQNIGALWDPDIARVFLAKIVGSKAEASAER